MLIFKVHIIANKQKTGVSIACSNFCSGAEQRKQQSSASLAFVKGSQRWPVDSVFKGSNNEIMFLFDDVIMFQGNFTGTEATARLLHRQWSNHENCGSKTHWDRVTHICVSKLTIIGSDNRCRLVGVSPSNKSKNFDIVDRQQCLYLAKSWDIIIYASLFAHTGWKMSRNLGPASRKHT